MPGHLFGAGSWICLGNDPNHEFEGAGPPICSYIPDPMRVVALRMAHWAGASDLGQFARLTLPRREEICGDQVNNRFTRRAIPLAHRLCSSGTVLSVSDPDDCEKGRESRQILVCEPRR